MRSSLVPKFIWETSRARALLLFTPTFWWQMHNLFGHHSNSFAAAKRRIRHNSCDFSWFAENSNGKKNGEIINNWSFFTSEFPDSDVHSISDGSTYFASFKRGGTVRYSIWTIRRCDSPWYKVSSICVVMAVGIITADQRREDERFISLCRFW